MKANHGSAQRASRRAPPLKPWDYGTPKIGPFPKSLDGQLPFAGNPEFVRSQNEAVRVDMFESLLADCQSLEGLKPHEKPEWDPPGIEDKITDLDVARGRLEDTMGHREPRDWDEARVWREMYELTYDVADKLRQIAQNLDDKLDDEIANVEDHNNLIDGLAQKARRLQLDLGI